MSDMPTRLTEVRREIEATEKAIRPLSVRLTSLEAQRRDLESKIFIEVNKIKRGDVEPMNVKGGPFFLEVGVFGKWLAANSKKPWAEWNGRIYHTADLINNRMPDMPGLVDDLKE